MPVTPPSATVEFQSTFTQELVLTIGTDTAVTNISAVTASYSDPGVNVSFTSGTVTLSGSYQSIIPVTWHWKDLNDQMQSGPSAPPAGTYEKIIQVDSPASITTDCIYTIVSDAGTDTFTHTVDLVDYGKIKTALANALAGQPTPLMP